MSIDRFTDLPAIAILGGVLVLAGMWLGGVDTPATTRVTRRWSLLYPSLIGGLAVLNATGDWLMVVALGLWAVLEFAMPLVPDLLTRLRNPARVTAGGVESPIVRAVRTTTEGPQPPVTGNRDSPAGPPPGLPNRLTGTRRGFPHPRRGVVGREHRPGTCFRHSPPFAGNFHALSHRGPGEFQPGADGTTCRSV